MKESIQKMFDDLPRVYELINHVVSLGLDFSWRRKAARLASSGGGAVWLDVSTGTGEMAAYLGRLADARVTLVATDFSMPMLLRAREKKEAKGRINFVLADTGRLPFASGSLDLVTTSMATRNITTSRENLISCLREFHRVLGPGGRFVNLETSQPTSQAVKRLFHQYVRRILRPVGAAISGSKSAYSYLAGTICGFYNADELTGIIREAGFETVAVKRLFMGVAAVHRAEKAARHHCPQSRPTSSSSLPSS
jgi:demethylmenaquinone methyltransferase/2-methoxy-6-polyprenyl-1,4-benzoquinol methylase